MQPFAWFPTLKANSPRVSSFGNLPYSLLSLVLKLPMNWLGMFLLKIDLATPHSGGLQVHRLRMSSLSLTNFHDQLNDISSEEIKAVHLRAMMSNWLSIATRECKGSEPGGYHKFNEFEIQDDTFQGYQAPKGQCVAPIILEILECVY